MTVTEISKLYRDTVALSDSIPDDEPTSKDVVGSFRSEVHQMVMDTFRAQGVPFETRQEAAQIAFQKADEPDYPKTVTLSAQEHAALREEIERHGALCQRFVEQVQAKDGEIARLNDLLSLAERVEDANNVAYDKMREAFDTLDAEHKALHEKAAKVYRLRQDWLADDSKGVEFYNSIICLGHVLGPNVAATTGEQEAATLRATLATVRKTVEECLKEAEARHETAGQYEIDEQQGRIDAFGEVLALLPEEGS